MRLVSLILAGAALAAHTMGLFVVSSEWLDSRAWQSAGYASMTPIPLSGAVLAAWGAAQAWRQRSAEQLIATATRPRIGVTLRWFAWPLVTVGLVWALSALVLSVQAQGPLTWPSVAPLVVALPLAGCGIVAVGAVLGRLLPAFVSIPLSAVAVYLTFVWSMQAAELAPRHLVGFHVSCCMIDREPALLGTVAPAAFWGSVAILGFGALANSASRWIPALAVALGALLVAAAFWPAANRLDVDASAPRPRSLLVCEESRVRVCLWPESEDGRQRIQKATDQVASALDAVGAETPAEASEVAGAAWTVSVFPEQSDLDALWSAAVGLASSPPPDCAATKEWTMGLYQGAMGAWVSLAAGVEAEVVEARVLPEDLQEARRILAMEPAAQGKWFTANRLKLGQCDVGPTR